MPDRKKSSYLIRLVDDDEEFLDAIGFMLRTEGWRTRAWQDPEKFLSEVDASVPGCIVLDARMPGMTGLEVQQSLAERKVALPVVFLTGHGDLDMAVHVFRKGACDFLQKPVSREALMEAISRALERDDALRGISERTSPRALWMELTDRERQVVADIAQGLTNRLTAEHLGLSERTVESYRANALKKIGIRSDELAAWYARARSA